MTAVNRGSTIVVSAAFSRLKVRDMYPLLYEAAMTLRTTSKDAAVRDYLRLEYPGAAPAWLYQRRPAAVRHARTSLVRRILRKLRTPRPIPSAADVEGADASYTG